ncbi:hypothetical protein SNEBB_000175 [Seison nebaliae]|nr:hypothetical protein SNEBB_000175 [Seison nebaliae]
MEKKSSLNFKRTKRWMVENHLDGSTERAFGGRGRECGWSESTEEFEEKLVIWFVSDDMGEVHSFVITFIVLALSPPLASSRRNDYGYHVEM